VFHHYDFGTESFQNESAVVPEELVPIILRPARGRINAEPLAWRSADEQIDRILGEPGGVEDVLCSQVADVRTKHRRARVVLLVRVRVFGTNLVGERDA